MSAPTPYTAPAAPAGKTNTLAIIALIGAFVVSPAGIICGHIALNQIKKTGEAGRGLALWGTILGYVFTAFWIVWILIAIAFFFWQLMVLGSLGAIAYGY